VRAFSIRVASTRASVGVRRTVVVIIQPVMKNIVILISGGGSNMAAIVRAAQREDWGRRFGAEVAAVISNKGTSDGLVFAKEQGLDTEVLDHTQFDSRESFDAALAAPLRV